MTDPASLIRTGPVPVRRRARRGRAGRVGRGRGASPATRRSSPATSRAGPRCPACSWSRRSPRSAPSRCCRRALRRQAPAVRRHRRRALPPPGRARRDARPAGRDGPAVGPGRQGPRRGVGRRRDGLRGRPALRASSTRDLTPAPPRALTTAWTCPRSSARSTPTAPTCTASASPQAGPHHGPDCFQEAVIAALRAYPTLRDASEPAGVAVHDRPPQGARPPPRASPRRRSGRRRRPSGRGRPPSRPSTATCGRRCAGCPTSSAARSPCATWAISRTPRSASSLGCSEAAARQNVRAGLAALRQEVAR